MIDIERLSKRYSKEGQATLALADFSLSVRQGEMVALLGENGAGKSTLLRILSTLIKPDSGHASVAGFDLVKQAKDVREAIGVALQDVSLYPAGRVRQVLDLHAQLHGLNRLEMSVRSNEVIELMGLNEVSTRKVHQLSGGMRRRLDLGLALIHQPSVLILDEPTASLDPHSRNRFWQELNRLRNNGICILLATQSMQEAEHLADRAVVLVNGAVWLDDAPATALSEMTEDVQVV
jgi:ABC-type multidrug transport system ATPase subunit